MCFLYIIVDYTAEVVGAILKHVLYIIVDYTAEVEEPF